MHAAQTNDAKPRLRYRLSKQLNLLLAKRLKVPRVPSIRAARALSYALAPFGHLPRKRLAAELARSGDKRIAIDPREGYAFLEPDCLPEIAPALEQARTIYNHAEQAGELSLYDEGRSRKGFLVYATYGAMTAQYHDLMRLALARPLLEAVSTYLGSIPVLNDVNVMVSLPNDSEVGSQLYHLDFADERQIKLFLNVDVVSEDNGPFTFVTASDTNRLIEKFKYDRGRLSIEEVTEAIGDERQVKAVGPSGSGLLVDTSSCLHYGSNKNNATRIVILVQYTDYYVPEQPPTTWPVDELVRELDLDDVQQMALKT